jgi:hypothetical protein
MPDLRRVTSCSGSRIGACGTGKLEEGNLAYSYSQRSEISGSMRAARCAGM